MKQYSPEFWSFVQTHSNDDVARLRLKYHGVQGDIDYDDAILQIECRKKFGKKLASTLVCTPHFVFPNTLAGEQCTSDALSLFHSSLINEDNTVCDLTCGLGIDSMYFARRAAKVVAVERQLPVAEALSLNAESAGYENVIVVNGDCCELLRQGRLTADVAFIDPARRTQTGGRAYAIADCEPNVVELMPLLSRYFDRLIVKMSPMLDITQTLRDLKHTAHLYAVGTHTECKELVADVWLTEKAYDPLIHAVTVNNDGSISDYSFNPAHEAAAPAPQCADVAEGCYVYELLPALMKAGPLRLIAAHCGLKKLHNNTHVFFSETLNREVPAVAWVVERIIPWQSKTIKRVKAEYPKIDVAVRNFGMSADDLRTKLGVKQGGDRRLLGVTDRNENRLMLILRKP
jgi:hypothetical protein